MVTRFHTAVVLTLISVWFVYLTLPTLSIGFHLDDISNLYRGWEPSIGQMLAANLSPFSTIYRPVGGLYYRLVYSVAGLDPFYFRLVTYCFLIVNIGLVFAIARRLFDSLPVAALSALFFCVHRNMYDLFHNNGTSYDVLCGTFFLSAVLVYDRARNLTWRTGAIVLILFVLAVNSKEVGLALPFVLIAYEIWFRRGLSYTVFLTVLAVMAIVAAKVKTGEGSVLHGHPEYIPVFTVDVLGTNLRRAIEWLAGLQQDSMQQSVAWLILALAIALVALSRNWRIAFTFSAALLSAVPALFIVWRGLFVFYIPYAFLSITAAALIIKAYPKPSREHNERILRPALLTALVLLVCIKQFPVRAKITGPSEQVAVRRMIHQLYTLKAGPPPGGSILILHTLHDAEWVPLMLARLRFGDKSIWASSMDAGRCEPGRRYDLVVDFARKDDLVVSTGVPGSVYCPAGK